MVAAEAADVKPAAKPAAASAALPETKVRLFNRSSFGADPMRGGEQNRRKSPAIRGSRTITRYGNYGGFASAPVLRVAQQYVRERHGSPSFPPYVGGHGRRFAGGRPAALSDVRGPQGRGGLEAWRQHPHGRAGGPRRHHRHRGPPAGGFPPAELGPVLRGRQQVGGRRRHRLDRSRQG